MNSERENIGAEESAGGQQYIQARSYHAEHSSRNDDPFFSFLFHTISLILRRERERERERIGAKRETPLKPSL